MSNKNLLTVVLADISNQDSPQVITLKFFFNVEEKLSTSIQ